MPFWSSKKASADVPYWATPLRAEQYSMFMRTTKRALDDLRVPGDRDPARDGTLTLRASDGEEITAGLQNLAQIVADEPPSDWLRIISEFFDGITHPEQKPSSPVGALAALRLRIWHPDYLQQSPELLHKLIAPGLMVALVVDLPKSITGVKHEDLATWAISLDDAWVAAERNTKSEPIQIVPNRRPDGSAMPFLTGDNLYVTSHALWIDQLVQLEPARGALVGLPTRHLMAVYPIHDLRVLTAVTSMHVANRRIFDEGPGSISPEVYWWLGGEFTQIPIDTNSQPAKVIPPDAFVQLLNSLPSIPS